MEAGIVSRTVASLPPIVVLGATGAAAMLIPAAHAGAQGKDGIAGAFLSSALVFLTLMVLAAIAGARRPRPARARSMLLTMLATYAALPLMLATPLAMALPDTGLFNAWWEMVSCLTTTGASLYDPARLADSLHLWRALVGWLGGLFILVAAIAILSPLRIGGFEIMTSPFGRPDRFGRLAGAATAMLSPIAAEAADSGFDAPGHRLGRAFAAVFPVYATLTVALWLALLVAGDPGLVAASRAMGTLSTSGIAPVGGPVGARSGFLGEAIVLAFFVPALSRRFWPGGGELRASERLRDDPELRMAAGLVGAIALILFARHFFASIEAQEGAARGLRGAASAAWGGLFNGLSYLTTTGWTSTEWERARNWAGLTSPGLMLAGLAIMGGGVATTAGGVKLLRVYALARQAERELERVLHPASIPGGGRAARRLRREGAYLAFIFFMLFAVSIAVTVMLVSVQNVRFDTATILSVAALTNTGPLAGSIPLVPAFEGSAGFAGAPWNGWAGLQDFTKAILAGAMVVGRMETLAILALFSPGIWRR